MVPAPARSAARHARAVLEVALPLLVLLAGWELIARLRLVHPALFPPVTEIAARAWELTREGVFLQDILHSLLRLLGSVLVAIVAGTAGGLVMGTSRRVERALGPPLHFFLAIPGIAIFPLVILWFGLTETAIVVTLAFEASLSVALNTWAGVKGVDPALLTAARALGARGHRLFRHVLVPGALPAILTGYRQGFSRAWRILVAGEMLASAGTGLGFRIFEARAFLASDVMYAGVIVIGILGVLLERVAVRSIEIVTVQRWGMVREL